MNNNFLQCENFKVYYPMKYCGNPNQKIIDEAMINNNWVLQQKLDGSFYQLIKNNEGEVGLFSRTVSKKDGLFVNKIANVPHIKQWAKAYMPNNTVFLGEIYVEGGHSNDVTKIMGCLPQKAIARQEEQGYVTYNIFDCIRWEGEDICNLGFWERYCLLEHQYIEWLNDRIAGDEIDIVNIIPCYTLQKETHGFQRDSFQEQLSKIFAIGGEGAVFKKKDSIYRPGMRTTASQAFKMKEHVDSLDLVIIDVLDPEMKYTGKEIDNWPYYYSLDSGKKYLINNKEYQYINDTNIIAVTKPFFYGWKNALRLGAYNNEGNLVEVCRVASGLTDADRANLGRNSSDYIGSVVEISCMSLNKKDLTVRHPVLLYFRTDKNPQDCLISEIFGE